MEPTTSSIVGDNAIDALCVDKGLFTVCCKGKALSSSHLQCVTQLRENFNPPSAIKRDKLEPTDPLIYFTLSVIYDRELPPEIGDERFRFTSPHNLSSLSVNNGVLSFFSAAIPPCSKFSINRVLNKTARLDFMSLFFRERN